MFIKVVRPRSKFRTLIIILVVIGIAAAIFFLFVPRSSLVLDYFTFENLSEKFNGSKQHTEVVFEVESPEPEPPKRTKPPEIERKVIYITSWTATLPSKIDHFIELIDTTELNAAIIDIKDYTGFISYDSDVEKVNEYETEDKRITDIHALLKKFKDKGIYLIARQTVFQDPAMAQANPDWAVKDTRTGKPWKDWKGLQWIDPTNKNAWQYNIAIAKEAIDIGFDEINFDYIRFPSDGPTAYMEFADLQGRERHEVMHDFFKYISEQLADEPAYTSVDLFGLTTEREDDMMIGQQIEDAAPYIDYICPMVYPSHYPIGYLNYNNPAAHPYEVIYNAISKGVESINTVENVRAKISPWLQDFDMGATYTADMIRKQITASDEAGGYGWLMWNSRNVYTESVYKKDDQTL